MNIAPGQQDDDLTGRTAGSYRIEARIGAGGMGEVFRAHDAKLDRPVALKLLSAEVARDPERLRRFRAEARAASSLNHPHILVIHDFGELDARPFIVTELVEGETLRARLERGPIPARAALDIAVQVASALSAAHARGLVHRDIKPENIMLRPDGYVKVLDFGLAKLIAADAADAESVLRTQPGVVMGTPRYMSPEQARGHDTDPRTDVWSVGVVLYEMLTGRPPFAGATAADVIAGILATEPAAVDTLARDVPERVAAIVGQALRKRSSDRYASAADLHTALVSARSVIESGAPAIAVQTSAAPARQHTVGRDPERAEILTAFRSAAAGRGHILSVSGDAGSGKTTLVESCLEMLATGSSPCRVGRGRCSERLAGSEAYLPILEAIESLADASPDVALQLAAVAPAWHAQITTATPGDGTSDRAVEPVAGSQERLKRELAAFVRDLAREQPLVLFFDDVHWADASTIDLLAYLALRFADQRVLVIVTSRPSDLILAGHPFVSLRQDLQARRLCHELTLEMLTREDVHRYLALECPGHQLPAEFPALIHGKTEGSPLFMADLVRYLKAGGTLRQDADGRWLLHGTLDAVGRDLPESVRGMIERKIAQVGDQDRTLLTAASVQGYEFDSTVVAQALGQDPGLVEDRLEVLDRVHRFVRLVEEREFPGGTPTLRYRFVHVLYQNALYGQLRATRKVTLCRAVAETLLQLHGARHGEVASELAALFADAREFLRAADYYRLAALHAAALFASREAVVLATRGLSLLEPLPDTRERQERELGLRIALANALIATRGYFADEVMAAWTRAHAICEQLGETPHLFNVLYGFSAAHLTRGNHATALEYGRQLLALTERERDPAVVVGHRMVGWPLLAMGRLDEARGHFESAIAIYAPASHRRFAYICGQEPGMASHVILSMTLALQGDADGAARHRQAALALAREVPHANSQGYAFHFAAVAQQWLGDRAGALDDSTAALKLAEEQGMRGWLGWSAIVHGWAVAAGGRVDDGIAEMRDGLALAHDSGAVLFETYYLGLLADLLSGVQRFDEADAFLDRADALVEQTGERFWVAELVRLRGALAAARGHRAAAVESFERARAIAQQQGAQSLVRRAAASLDQLLTRASDLGHQPRRADPQPHESAQSATPVAATDAIDSLAVMPFVNAGGHADTEYLSDGIPESLINALSQLPALRVAPRSKAFRYKGREIDPVEVGRELNVRALLTGKVLQRGDTLNVQVDLVDVARDSQLWGDRFHRGVSDIFTVEEDIARQIADKLRLTLSGRDRTRLVKRHTQDSEAYHRYLKGRYHWNKRSAAGLKKALEYFQQAVEADPGYALAHAGLADGYLLLSVFASNPALGFAKRGKAAALKALEIDGELAEALTAYGLLRWFLDWEWTAAEADLARAVSLKPDYWLARDHYAMILSGRGQHDEAIRQIERGLALEPLSPVVGHHAAWIFIRAGLYDRAIEQCREALEIDPTFGMAHLWLGLACSLQSRHDEAIRALESARRVIGSTFATLELARACAGAGRTADAERLLAEMHAAFDRDYAEPYGFATVYAALGRPDDAFHWLDRAADDRSAFFVAWVNGDPRLDSLQSDARMADLLRRIGVAHA